jgi:hypothetical protein
LTRFWQVVEQNRRLPLRETSKKTRPQAGASQAPKRSPCPAPTMRAMASAQTEDHMGTRATSAG